LKDFERLARTLQDVFREPPAGVREVRQVFAIRRILDGEASSFACANLKLQRQGIEHLVEQKLGSEDYPVLSHSVKERLLSF
jgi:hypothetical protein